MGALARFELMLAAALVSVSCGSGGGSMAGAPAAGGVQNNTNAPSPYSMVVASDTELPACAAANRKQLVYVSSTKNFRTCEEAGWTTIEIGGLSVVSNSRLAHYSTNLCTYYSSMNTCLFRGGQLVTYSDGSVLLTSTYTNYFVAESPNTGDSEYDKFENSISFLIAPTMTYAYQVLDESVARGTPGFRDLFLVYVRSSNSVLLVYDTNNNGTPEPTDEVVHTVAITAW